METVLKNGFRVRSVTDIQLDTAQIRRIDFILQIEPMAQTMGISSADPTRVQTESSERAGVIDNAQINRIQQKGRDVFGMLALMPGVVDTSNRDYSSLSALAGITINGNPSLKNVLVDGLANLDIGCGNCAIQGNPNLDAVREVKVLTSNYQAEFGRNSGGTIAIATRSGTPQFHGVASWNHRHEQFNANNFFNNRSGIPNPKYRFNIATWALGGPIFIPARINTERNKFFFFASQEYTRQFPGASTVLRQMPSGLERAGDFSRSFSTNGKLILITDPDTHQPFAGNIIPQSRVDQIGQNILNFFPLPNYAPTIGSADYFQYNYRAVNVGAHPRRDDVFRSDANLTRKLNAYFRVVKDTDSTAMPFGNSDWAYAPITHPWPGYTFGGSATYAFSAHFVNELSVGKSGSTWDYYEDHPEQISRTLWGNVPKLFTIATAPPTSTYTQMNGQQAMYNFLPAVTFGSTPANSSSFGIGSAVRHNPVAFWTYYDNLSMMAGKHNIKTGFYLENDWKHQTGNAPYNGAFSFGATPAGSFPLDTGDAYANALIEAFSSYTEATALYTSYVTFTNLELYAQDNWRLSRNLTLDLGIRFYHQSPQVDQNGVWSYFDPSQYNATSGARQFIPGKTASGTRVALDPVTGAVADVAAIGSYVPNSGSFSNGMVVPGRGQATYRQAWLTAAPRLGFAYDFRGRGKTAVRGGYGTYYNRLDGNQVYNMTGSSPVGFQAIVYNNYISSLSTGHGYIAPQAASYWSGSSPWGYVTNASIGVQQAIGWDTVLDVSWVGDYGRNQPMRDNINAIPLGADFAAAFQDPTQPGRPLPATLERVSYPGLGDLNKNVFIGYTNYNALQTSLNHRLKGALQFGVSYTWSHSLGLIAFDPLVADNTARNYGPLSTDRRQVATFNYSYQLPSLGSASKNRLLDTVTRNWTLSGITTTSSGAPFQPSFTTSPAVNITGSSSEIARINVAGNPLDKVQSGYFFNPVAFAEPTVGTIGNAGVNDVTGPGYTNVDMTMAKSIPVRDKGKFIIRAEAYNIFNHTEYNAVNAAYIFNASGVNTQGNVGTYSAARPARIISFTVRFEF